MKQYPEGTRWAVRRNDGWWCVSHASGCTATYTDEHNRFVARELAKASMWHARYAYPLNSFRLVRLTPKPPRTVEERIKAVRADALNGVLRWAYGEGRGASMPIAVLTELETLLASQGADNIRPTLERQDLATLVHATTKAAVDAAVRERTEVILAEWQAPWSESQRRPFGQHFADWLRDLRDGKVT